MSRPVATREMKDQSVPGAIKRNCVFDHLGLEYSHKQSRPENIELIKIRDSMPAL